MAEAIHAHTVSEIIVQRFLDDISAGKLSPGDRLPSQRQLARDMGVSMAALREALRSLQAMGIIEIRHGIGACVSRSPLKAISRGFDWSVFLSAEEVDKIMEARQILEVGLARAAATRASEAHLQELANILDAMAMAFRNQDESAYEDADIRFHLALARASDNPLLVHFAEILLSALEAFIKAVPHTAAGYKRHQRVLDAIREHNPRLAEAAMRRLLAVTEAHYQRGRLRSP